MSNNAQSMVIDEEHFIDLKVSLEQAEKLDLVVRVEEKNPYVLLSFKGQGLISEKWNVKVYTFNLNKRGHSVVCNDLETLTQLMLGDFFGFNLPDLPVISIDDSGWGFPLCGVMVGATDGKAVVTDVVEVYLFLGKKFKTKDYLGI